MLWIIKIPPWRPVRNMWFRSGSQSVNKIYLVIITTDPPQVVWILTSWYSLSYSKTAIHKRREIQESKRSELRHRGVKSIQRGESMNEHLTETRGDFRRKERVSEWVSEWDWEREREREPGGVQHQDLSASYRYWAVLKMLQNTMRLCASVYIRVWAG